MSKIKVIIVDDEKHCIASLRALLGNDTRVDLIAGITDPLKAVTEIVRTKPDLLFLDIQMPGKSGFEVIADLKDAGVKPPVIFVTAYDKFAIEAIRNSAFDYLLKPVNTRELTFSIDRFEQSLAIAETESRYISLLEQVARNQRLKFNTNGGFIIIDPREIIYVKADWNYSEIVLKGDKKELVTLNIGSVEKMLPSSTFMRVNRSTLINLEYLTRVKRLARSVILVEDGREYTFPIPLLKIRQLEKML